MSIQNTKFDKSNLSSYELVVDSVSDSGYCGRIISRHFNQVGMSVSKMVVGVDIQFHSPSEEIVSFTGSLASLDEEFYKAFEVVPFNVYDLQDKVYLMMSPNDCPDRFKDVLDYLVARRGGRFTETLMRFTGGSLLRAA